MAYGLAQWASESVRGVICNRCKPLMSLPKNTLCTRGTSRQYKKALELKAQRSMSGIDVQGTCLDWQNGHCATALKSLM